MLLKHHCQLVYLLSAVFELNLKSIQPLSLFDNKGRAAFFKPLNSTASLAVDIDENIQAGRRQFLSKIITQSVYSLGLRDGTPSEENESIYKKWTLNAIDLSEELLGSSEVIVRHHIVQMLSSGFDEKALEMLDTLEDHSVVGSQIILIAGQRLAHYIYSCDSSLSVQRIANCSPYVSTWLKTLDVTQIRFPSIEISFTFELLKELVKRLPENHAEFKMALSLQELAETFI